MLNSYENEHRFFTSILFLIQMDLNRQLGSMIVAPILASKIKTGNPTDIGIVASCSQEPNSSSVSFPFSKFGDPL